MADVFKGRFAANMMTLQAAKREWIENEYLVQRKFVLAVPPEGAILDAPGRASSIASRDPR